MTGLLRAEVRRLTSRRLARVLAAVFLGILLLTQIVNAVKSHEATPQDRAQVTSIREECEAQKVRGEFPAEIDCAEIYGDPDPRFSAAEVLPEMAGGVAVAAAIVAFVVGASYIGAEWGAGTMQALLFWEPRRHRVILAKAAALVGVLVAFTALMQAVGWSTTMLVASTRGTTEGVTGAVQSDAVGTMLRGMFVLSFTGLLGFAFAGLARVTGFALGAAFGYFVILEQVIAGLRPGWFRYLVSPNIAAVMSGGIDDIGADSGDSFEGAVGRAFRLTAGRGMLVLSVYLVVVVGAFSVSFSRRDVT